MESHGKVMENESSWAVATLKLQQDVQQEGEWDRKFPNSFKGNFRRNFHEKLEC